MPIQRLLPQQWMHVSKEIRDYLALMWKVPQSGITEVRDQEIITDGHTYEDLAVITLDRMCDYIGSEESFARAWEVTVAKAHSELHPPVGIIRKNVEDAEIPEDIEIEEPKKRGRPAKQHE
jgi:hypothetical protein